MAGEFESQMSDMKEELDGVRNDVNGLKVDVSAIKTAVTNHITHQLEDIQVTLTSLDGRITPFEKRKLKKDGAHELVTFIVKIIIGVAGLTWTVLEIIKHVSA